MSRRFSREDKGKRVEDNPPFRKPLVRVPETNVSELIERNKLTLIGRVTNPSIQKTRALVDFFLQQWHVVGRITGRDLGPSLFQFCFESEQDLQTILAKAPFHFKNWMVIIRKWEPIVSESFPALILFWVRVHGIPLHYWTDQTIEAIGAILGPIEDREVNKLRFRVLINGLQPLIMKLDLELPSKEVVEVEVEYERLGKHYFFCKSLAHEDSEKHRCPLSRGFPNERRNLGITQQNTLERIEEGRRRQEERRISRHQNGDRHRDARWTNTRVASRVSEEPSRGHSSRDENGRSSGVDENRRRYDDRNLAYKFSTPRNSQSQFDSQERTSTSRKTHVYKVREPSETERSRILPISPVREAMATSQPSPVIEPSREQRRGSIASRLSDPRSAQVLSEERIPAKERLSVNTRRTSGLDVLEPETAIAQAKDKSLVDSVPGSGANTAITRPSSSTIFVTGRLGPCERSSIRTLSEDRIHVSLRLGPVRDDVEDNEDDAFDLQLQHALSSKAAGKRIVSQSKDKKRSVRTSPQEAPVKKRRTTKAHPSPRRKLMLDAITTGGRAQSKKKQKATTAMTIIPPRVRKGTDFRPPKDSLP
ncbi:hypothetical protein Bca4012_081735 [Brassica carinata]